MEDQQIHPMNIKNNKIKMIIIVEKILKLLKNKKVK